MEKKSYCTTGKTALTAFFAAAGDTPRSADAIFAALTARGFSGGRSTVYRLLAAAVRAGEVKKFRAGDGSATWLYQYVGKNDCAHHFHLQCLSCGRVAHLDCDCGAEIAAHLAAQHGFLVDRGKTVLYGLCAACGGHKTAESVGTV